jgi:hypothetical protein
LISEIINKKNYLKKIKDQKAKDENHGNKSSDKEKEMFKLF